MLVLDYSLQCLILCRYINKLTTYMEMDEENYRGMGISRLQYIGLLSALCNQGDAEGRYLMGELYEEGEVVERDMDEAMHLYRLAAEQGFAKAQHRLGYKYFMGTDCELNLSEGVHFMCLAAEQGNVMSLFGLGMAYLAGRGVERNVELALEYFRRSAAGGYEPAVKMLTSIEQEGASPQSEYVAMFVQMTGAEEQLVQAYRQYSSEDEGERRASFHKVRALAETGYGKACFVLAYMYLYGMGTEHNEGKFVVWLSRAAEAGFPEAQDQLAGLYARGERVEQDYAAAAYWRTLAAEQGLVASQRSLAAQYISGDGVPQDDAAAAYWYLQAAEQGDAQAQYLLALKYRDGKGVEQNSEQMLHWLQCSADQKFALAQLLLGMSYAVMADWQNAIPLFTSAAEQQDWQAMVCLAALYARGVGVKRSLDRAEDYNRMASKYASHEERVEWYNDFLRRAKL